MLKNKHIHIIQHLKVRGNFTFEFIKPMKLSPYSKDLILLAYRVWKKFTKLVYQTFQLMKLL
jgi:hypothetical protein